MCSCYNALCTAGALTIKFNWKKTIYNTVSVCKRTSYARKTLNNQVWATARMRAYTRVFTFINDRHPTQLNIHETRYILVRLGWVRFVRNTSQAVLYSGIVFFLHIHSIRFGVCPIDAKWPEDLPLYTISIFCDVLKIQREINYQQQ